MTLKIKLTLYLLVFVLLLPQISFSQDESNHRDIENLILEYDAIVSSYIETSENPGVAVAIVADGKIVLLKGYGVKKAGKADHIKRDTTFRLASVSKGFASVLTGILVQDGVLQWDDRVTKYLPEFSLKDKENTDHLTIRNILNHTSGLVPHAYDNLIEADVPFEKIIDKLQELPSYCSPGECYGYQNAFYSLITEVIESATGKDYSTLLSERILKPLEMNRVSFSKKALLSGDNYACPHETANYKLFPVTPKGTYYSTPAASGLNASIEDMAQWLLAMLGNREDVIPASVIEEVCRPSVKTSRELRRYNWKNRLNSVHYGMGWRVFNYSGHNLVYHSGNVYGYFAAVGFLPEHNTGIVILQNSRIYSRYVYAYLDMYLGIRQEDPESYFKRLHPPDDEIKTGG
jgi:beta-lactamase class C